MTFVIVKLSPEVIVDSDCSLHYSYRPCPALQPEKAQIYICHRWTGGHIHMTQVNNLKRWTYMSHVTCHIRLDDENHLWQFCRLPHSRIIHPARIVHLYLNFCKERFLCDNDNCVHALSRKYQNMLYSCLILYIVYRIYIGDIERDDKIFKPVWCRIWKHFFWAPHSPPCFYIWLTFVLQGSCFHIWLVANICLKIFMNTALLVFIFGRLSSSLSMW